QEAVVARRRLDDADLVGAGDALRQLPLLGQRVQVVAADPADHGAGGDTAQRRGHPAAAPTHVVGVHGLGEHHVAARVEAAGQLGRVVVQVGLDGEPAPRHRVLTVLGGPSEPLVELGGAPVGDVRDTAGDAQPGHRSGAGTVVVVAAVPVRIGPDGV